MERTRTRPVDVPAALLLGLADEPRQAAITATEPGVICGTERMTALAAEMGLTVLDCLPSGAPVGAGEAVARLRGPALALIRGEDLLLGVLSKPSGVATAAALAQRAAPGVRVVSGGWKKMPLALKDPLREALAAVGAGLRLCDGPFVYLDKNYVRLLGCVRAAVERAKLLPGRAVAVQLRGELEPIGAEAISGALAGADVLMVDTGDLGDLRACRTSLAEAGLLPRVRLAFAGGVTIPRLPEIARAGAQIVDMGRAVLDAPLLDLRYDIKRSGAEP